MRTREISRRRSQLVYAVLSPSNCPSPILCVVPLPCSLELHYPRQLDYFSWTIQLMARQQTPAQRAANRAFHKSEESKKGKKAVKVPGPSAVVPEQEKPVRHNKTKKPSKINTGLLLLMLFLVCGGGVMQLASLFFSK